MVARRMLAPPERVKALFKALLVNILQIIRINTYHDIAVPHIQKRRLFHRAHCLLIMQAIYQQFVGLFYSIVKKVDVLLL